MAFGGLPRIEFNAYCGTLAAGSPVNIKNFTSLSNIVLVVLLTGIGVLVFHSLSVREEMNKSERHRFRAILLADELLHTSDDLTRMARSYVITGDPVYKRHFTKILQIREGLRPHPLEYSPTYWHLIVAGELFPAEQGENLPMLDRFRKADLNEEEYDLLEQALERSDNLARMEREAFAALEGRFADAKGNLTVRGKPNRNFAINLLFSDRYNAEKAEVMQPIQKFMELFDERMQIQSNRELATLERQVIFEMVLIFTALLATMAIIFYTRLGILQPLADLARQVAGVTRGIRPSRYGKATSHEVAKLAEALALADEEKHRLLEKERIARNEAERASRLKDEFLATLSHELRTPLNAILGWSQLILSGNMKNGDIHKGLATIERNARAQNKLIEDLLEMSSIISGKVRLDMQQMDIASLIEAAVESVRPTAQAKGVTLKKTIAPRIGTITGDSSRLQQIFWNLLSNSIKFTPKGGWIEVVVEQSGSFLEIRINDSGLGISPEFMPYVFDRFRQGDASLTRQYGGLGLGLAIVKQLAELHGGTVRAESAGANQGSSFVVNLPLSTTDEGAVKSLLPYVPHPSDQNRSLAGVKILVIDDEEDARELLSRMLGGFDANVIAAAGTSEGLALLKTEKPDVVISDISMPDEDGYHFIAEVRKFSLEDGGATPAIALTAFAHAEDRARAIRAGYQYHLSKPVDSNELVSLIDHLVAHKKATDK